MTATKGLDVQMLVALDALATAQAEQVELNAFFDQVAVSADAMIGHKLFTVMAFHPQTLEVERVYSSRGDVYPAGGRKKKRDTVWGKQVLEQGLPYIGRNADDIRQHFTDHQLISGLGLEAILNMPIRVAGQTIGTMNLLHQADHYSAADVPTARLLTGLIAPRLKN